MSMVASASVAASVAALTGLVLSPACNVICPIAFKRFPIVRSLILNTSEGRKFLLGRIGDGELRNNLFFFQQMLLDTTKLRNSFPVHIGCGFEFEVNCGTFVTSRSLYWCAKWLFAPR